MAKFHLKLLVVSICCLCFAGFASAQQNSSRPIDSHMVSPQLVYQQYEKLGLSTERVRAIQMEMAELHDDMAAVQQELATANQKLSPLLSSESVSEYEALHAADDLFAAERKQRRIYLQLLVRLKNTLTVDEFAAALKMQRAYRERMAKSNPAYRGQQIQRLATHVKNEIRRRSEMFDPPEAAIESMQGLSKLMQERKWDEAESLLKSVLEQLEKDKDRTKPTQPTRPTGDS